MAQKQIAELSEKLEVAREMEEQSRAAMQAAQDKVQILFLP